MKIKFSKVYKDFAVMMGATHDLEKIIDVERIDEFGSAYYTASDGSGKTSIPKEGYDIVED